MVRKGLLLLLGGCFLGATVTWADDVGFVDCTSHPEATPILGKAAKTQEVVGSVPCGERFTIVQSGYFFTRIQTADGKIGFVYTNQISRDYAGSVAPQPAPAPARAQASQNAEVKTAARSSNPFSAIAGALRGNKGIPAQSLRIPPPPTPAPAPAAKAPETATVAQASPAAIPAQVNGIRGVTISDSSAATQAPANVPAPSAPAPAADSALFPAKTQIVVQSEVATNASAEAAKVQPSVSPAPVAPSSVTIAEANVAVVQPERTRVPESQPESAQPSMAEPRPAAFQPSDRGGFEKSAPRGSGRKFPLLELFGGFSFARLDGGAGTFTNMTGGMGSFGVNVTPWLQITGDSTYNMIQQTGTKTVLYGNHYGPRLYYRGRNRWNISPFVEALAGGSRVDTKVSGASGYTTSDRTFSYKVGGGVDIRPSRYIEVRLINVDYYRTAFGGGSLQQSNYWFSTGVVLRLLGGHAE